MVTSVTLQAILDLSLVLSPLANHAYKLSQLLSLQSDCQNERGIYTSRSTSLTRTASASLDVVWNVQTRISCQTLIVVQNVDVTDNSRPHHVVRHITWYTNRATHVAQKSPLHLPNQCTYLQMYKHQHATDTAISLWGIQMNPDLRQLQDIQILTHKAKHKPPVLSNNYYKIV